MRHFGLSIIPIIGGIYWWNIRVHVNAAIAGLAPTDLLIMMFHFEA